MVCWFHGPSNSDDDMQRYIDDLLRADRAFEGREPAVLMMYVEHENPPPNAAWRARIANATAHPRTKPLFVLAAESALIRGVVTAINWIRRPVYPVAVVSSADEGFARLEQHLPGAGEKARALLDGLRLGRRAAR